VLMLLEQGYGDWQRHSKKKTLPDVINNIVLLKIYLTLLKVVQIRVDCWDRSQQVFWVKTWALYALKCVGLHVWCSLAFLQCRWEASCLYALLMLVGVSLSPSPPFQLMNDTVQRDWLWYLNSFMDSILLSSQLLV